MKKIIFALCLLYSIAANALITIQSSTGGGASTGGAAFTSAFLNTNASVSLIIVHISHNKTTSGCSFGDNKGNTYILLYSDTSGTNVSDIYYCLNPFTGTGHQWHYTGCAGAALPSMEVLNLAGTATNTPFDQTSVGLLAAATSGQAGSITPLQNNEMIIAFGNSGTSSSAPTIDGGFSVSNNIASNVSHLASITATLIQTTPAAANPTITYGSSTQSVVRLVSVKVFPPAGGGGIGFWALTQQI